MVNSRYLVNRVGQAALTLFAVLTLSFGLLRLMPGSPVTYLIAKYEQSGEVLSQEQVNARVELYTNINPDQPIPIAYANYMASLLQGDLGRSILYNRPVVDVIADAMPWTILVSAVSMLLIFAIGIMLGAVMAYVEGSRFDVGSTVVSTVITSVPFYVVAIIFLWFLGYQWEIFPTEGRVGQGVAPGMNVAFVGSILRHAAMPLGALVVAGFGAKAIAMRGNSIQILGNDYLRVARLRGLSERRIALRYVGRNAILPMYTGLMISIGGLFGGSIILEQIFTYPGMGYYVFKSLGARDYPLLMGGFLFITFGVVLGVLIADLTYGFIDPRAGSGGDRESF